MKNLKQKLASSELMQAQDELSKVLSDWWNRNRTVLNHGELLASIGVLVGQAIVNQDDKNDAGLSSDDANEIIQTNIKYGRELAVERWRRGNAKTYS